MSQIQEATSSQEKNRPILPWKVYTHHWSHFDEHVSLALLLEYGPLIHGLEGIRNYQLKFVDAGSPVLNHLDKRDWLWERIAALGVFGSWGPFDEHPDQNQSRQHKQSAASLTLRFLKKHLPDFADPRAEAIVAYATRIDVVGGATKDSLPNIVKSMNWLGNEPRTIDWVLKGINAYLAYGDPSQDAFELETIGALIPEDEGRISWLCQGHEARTWEYNAFQAAITTTKKEKHLFDIRYAHDKRGAKRKIVATESDNPLMARVIQSVLRADVAIVKNKKTRHIAILTRSESHVDLTGLVRMLNRRELELRHDDRYKHLQFGKLSPEGSLLGSVWSFQKSFKNQMCLNGSPSAPSVSPTKISLRWIAGAAAKALDETRFSTEAEGYACDGTSCGPEAVKQCSFYYDGLPRCIEIRSAARKASNTSFAKIQSDQKPKAKVIPIKAQAEVPKQVIRAADSPFAKLADLRSKLRY